MFSSIQHGCPGCLHFLLGRRRRQILLHRNQHRSQNLLLSRLHHHLLILPHHSSALYHFPYNAFQIKGTNSTTTTILNITRTSKTKAEAYTLAEAKGMSKTKAVPPSKTTSANSPTGVTIKKPFWLFLLRLYLPTLNTLISHHYHQTNPQPNPTYKLIPTHISMQCNALLFHGHTS
ncbi:hypothetical protein V6Z11_A06G071600 [Gossypium hirsutum]